MRATERERERKIVVPSIAWEKKEISVNVFFVHESQENEYKQLLGRKKKKNVRRERKTREMRLFDLIYLPSKQNGMSNV